MPRYVDIKCNTCGIIQNVEYKRRKKKFCSYKCYWESKKNIAPPYLQNKKIGRKISKALKGKPKPNSVKIAVAKANSERIWSKESRIRSSLSKSGDIEFTGFKSREQAIIRNRGEYKNWRKSVLKRDNNTCKDCGSTEHLEVHHIEPFRNNKKYDLNNGITYCINCHCKYDKYRYRFLKKIMECK